MSMVAGLRPMLVIAWEWHIGLALLCGCSGALEYPTTNSCGPINESLSLCINEEMEWMTWLINDLKKSVYWPGCLCTAAKWTLKGVFLFICPSRLPCPCYSSKTFVPNICAILIVGLTRTLKLQNNSLILLAQLLHECSSRDVIQISDLHHSVSMIFSATWQQVIAQYMYM